MFVLLIQNNAGKEQYLFKDLEPSVNNGLYYEFTDFEMPESIPYGEYTYFLFQINDEFEIEEKNVALDNVFKGEWGVCTLKDFKPLTGLLKYHSSDTVEPIQRDTNKEVIYRKRK